MSIPCPKCKTTLPWLKMKSAFSCPSCGVSLRAQTFIPWVVTIVLWSLVEYPLFAALQPHDDASWFWVVLVRSLISGGIGYLIGFYVVGYFSSVSLAPKENEPPT
ncbi:MAG: hypothetical protein ACYC9K_06170 [Sulfuricaulis sp.]